MVTRCLYISTLYTGPRLADSVLTKATEAETALGSLPPELGGVRMRFCSTQKRYARINIVGACLQEQE